DQGPFGAPSAPTARGAAAPGRAAPAAPPAGRGGPDGRSAGSARERGRPVVPPARRRSVVGPLRLDHSPGKATAELRQAGWRRACPCRGQGATKIGSALPSDPLVPASPGE